MATLRWVLCPHCGGVLNKRGTPLLAKKSIGATILETCPHCLKKYNTGFSEWEDKSKFEKIYVVSRTIVSSLMIGFFINFVLFFALMPIFSKLDLPNKDYLLIISCIFLIVFLLSFLTHWKSQNNAISASRERTKNKTKHTYT